MFQILDNRHLFFHISCLTIIYQSDITQLFLISCPNLKVSLTHFSFCRSCEMFFVCSLMHFPNPVIFYFFAEACRRTNIPAGLINFNWCKIITVRIGCTRLLQEPTTAIRSTFRNKAFLQSLQKLDIDKIDNPIEIHFLYDLRLHSFDLIHRILYINLWGINLFTLPKATPTDKRF